MRVSIIAAMVLGSLIAPLRAAQYALLVGVSRYPAFPPENQLEGPGPDVKALKEVLSRRYGFPTANIATLENEQATRQNILDALSRMVGQAGPGDVVLFYFSGHGTSPFDKNNGVQLADMIGPNSGALIPYIPKFGSLEEFGQLMIIGRRDLRPILFRLNKNAIAWVVLDSCYSQDTARSVGKWAGPVRGVNLVSVLGKTDAAAPVARQASVGGAGADRQTAMQARVSTESDEPYPYANVISFSAASRNEPAEDINTGQLRAGLRKTIDGQPHGAFTNGLLMALNGGADSNHDGVITFDELFRFTKDQMHASQTPQMLPDQGSALRKAVLTESRTPAPASLPSLPKTKVAVDGLDPSLETTIGKLRDIEIVSGGFDLLVRREKNMLALYQTGPVLIREYALADSAEMLTRIVAQANVQRLAAFRYPAQTFNLTVDADPVVGNVARKDYRAAIRIGQQAAISVSIEKPVYLLVLDIDKEGVISVLYPGPGDPQTFTGTTPVTIFKANAQAPAGAELIKAFGFIAKPAGFDEFTCRAVKDGGLDCPTIIPGNARYERLFAMLSSAAAGRAEAHAAMVTTE